MIVTDKKYFMERDLLYKLDLMISRSTNGNKLDNLIIVDGDEGYGKSNLAVGVGYYVAQTMGRSFSLKNVFFDSEELTKFAVDNDEQVIIWDEAALEGLAAEWRNKTQLRLIKLLMIARKKKHFWIFNIPKFFKLAEYIALDRSICLLHVYAKNEMKLGQWAYFNRKRKEKLYEDWRIRKKRNYKKHYMIKGIFKEVIPIVLDEDEYDKKKDEAIQKFGATKETKSKQQVQRDIMLKIVREKLGLKTDKQVFDILNDNGIQISQRRVSEIFRKLEEQENEIEPRAV